jgi:hypothetical protein
MQAAEIIVSADLRAETLVAVTRILARTDDTDAAVAAATRSLELIHGEVQPWDRAEKLVSEEMFLFT